MFKNIISVVFEKKLSHKTLNMVIEFSKIFNGKNMFLSLIDSKIINSICETTGRKKKNVSEEQISKRFEELYEIEEYFKSNGLMINFDAKIFSGYEEMNSILSSYEPDIVIFCEPDENELKDIIKLNLEVPIMILKK